MGVFKDYLTATYEGSKLEIESTLTLLGCHSRLIINNEEVDDAKCTVFTEISLQGKISEKEVKVNVKQGMLGTKYVLLIDGKECPLERIK